MKTFAVVESGVVVNIIVAGNSDDINWLDGGVVEITDSTIDKGYIYSNGVFSAPQKSKAEEISAAVQKKNLLLVEAQSKISLW